MNNQQQPKNTKFRLWPLLFVIIACIIIVVVMNNKENKENEVSKSESGNQVSASSSASSANSNTASTDTRGAVAHVGEYSKDDKLKITLKSAKEYTTVKTDNEFADTEASKGKKIIILNFEAENISKEDDYINIFYYDAYCDDVSVETDMLMEYPDGMQMFSGDIKAGKKLQGAVAYQVPEDWKILEFYYEPIDGNRFAFSVEKSEVEVVN